MTPSPQDGTTARLRWPRVQESASAVHNPRSIRAAVRAAPGIRIGLVAIVGNLLRPVRRGIRDGRRGLLRQCRIGRS
jgi:hypothetical protein